MSAFIDQIRKHAPAGTDVDYYISRVTSFPENEWFLPNNSDQQDFQICIDLTQLNVLARKTEPIWVSGGFRGYRAYFMWNSELKYPA